jgi:hypothetical protein
MRYLAYILFFTLVACDYIKKPQEPEAVARVGDDFLFRSDLQNLVPNGTSKEDSIAIVKSFIDRWATQKLLFEAAELNLNSEKVDELNQLMKQYKVDLFTNAYLEELIIRKLIQ